MMKIGHIRFYIGTPKSGWNMYGVGWKWDWFLGFSKQERAREDQP